MKNLFVTCLLCVIFYVTIFSVNKTYCFQNEQIEFFYNNRVFTYSLEENLKQSSQFDLNYEINKFNRFASKEERILLLKKMINLGFEKDIAIEYLFPNLTKKINSIAKNILIKPKDSQLKTDEQSSKVFTISREIIGLELDKPTLINEIVDAYTNNKKMKFHLPIKKIYPQTTSADYQKFTNLRADFSTNISTSSPSRKHNIKNALKSLNKTEIAPNEIFSFNKIVGKRTVENGYREAKIIVNNEFVDGLGGGVCQVSSTLYNSALLAGLEIVEANKHSKQVSYVKNGFDAMVNFGSSDLRIKNNTKEKIILITNIYQNSIRIRIYGESLQNTQYKLTNEVLNIVEPKEEIVFDKNKEYLDKVIFDDEFFYLKTASKGMEIKSYREKYVDNIFVTKELLRHDKFKVQNAVKVYGNTKREDENKKGADQICA